METLILVTLAFVVGFYVGKIVMRVGLTLAFILMLKDLGVSEADLQRVKARIENDMADPEKSSEESQSDLDVVEIKLEQHSGVIYAFRKDNDQFLGQGADQEALIRRLGEKMRNVRLLISREDGGELMGGRSWEYNAEDKTIK